jgi:hypothetical protein
MPRSRPIREVVDLTQEPGGNVSSITTAPRHRRAPGAPMVIDLTNDPVEEQDVPNRQNRRPMVIPGTFPVVIDLTVDPTRRTFTADLTVRNLSRIFPVISDVLLLLATNWELPHEAFVRGLAASMDVPHSDDTPVHRVKELVTQRMISRLGIPRRELEEFLDPLTRSRGDELLPHLIFRYRDQRGYERMTSMLSVIPDTSRILSTDMVNLATGVALPPEAVQELIAQLQALEREFSALGPEFFPEPPNSIVLHGFLRHMQGRYGRYTAGEQWLIEALVLNFVALVINACYMSVFGLGTHGEAFFFLGILLVAFRLHQLAVRHRGGQLEPQAHAVMFAAHMLLNLSLQVILALNIRLSQSSLNSQPRFTEMGCGMRGGRREGKREGRCLRPARKHTRAA